MCPCAFFLLLVFPPCFHGTPDLRFQSAALSGGDRGELLTHEKRPAILLRGLFASRLGRRTQESVTITDSHGAAATF